ncbi:uncharacterized protein LOC109614308 [Musca domestica]|uniref:Uncharacterized protein LOC109614308 n=1 Tax=Musca domestica TaxID=7370 RepID=A0ABM3V712_MUSDO|nr:uncharacterized protein LOC109614308 [Musca domestica]XP_058981561.1 uncharacterized protein LOC109614308 [Musca domestica]XP_058981562.1 uncharacterized protein LOC109614308 [Musca domestica]
MMDIKMNNNSFQSIRSSNSSNYISSTTSSGTGHKSPLEREDFRQQPYQCPKRLNKSREKLTSHISAELSPPSRRCPSPPAHPPLKLVTLNEICPKNGCTCQCFQGGFCEHGSFVASGQEVATRIVRRTTGRDGEHATTLNSGKCGNIEEEEQQSRRTCPTQQNLQHPDDEKEQQEPQRLAKYRLSNSNWNSSSSSRPAPSLNSGCYNISNTTTNNSIISHKQEEDVAVDFHKTTSAASREPANCWSWWCWSNRESNLPLRTLGCGQQVGHITTTEGGTTTSSSSSSLHSTKLYPAKQQHGQSNKSLKCKTKSPSSTSASSTWPKCFSSSLSSSSSSSSLSSITQAMAGIYNNIIRHFGLQLCCLLLLRLTMITSAVAVGMDAANANLTDLGSPGM